MDADRVSPDHPRARQVLEIFGELFGAQACDLYSGICDVMASTNPARFVMAAAAVREIMDLIEHAAGYEHRPPDARVRIGKLEGAWRVAQQADTGSGEALQAFAPALTEFFAHFKSTPSRRELAQGTLRQFDPSLRDSSPAVQATRVTQWRSQHKYFNLVLHRKKVPSPAEFEELFADFEEFLVRWLRPPTSADRAAIDAILREGPPDA